MPYQLSTQSVRKNWETPVHVAGSVGVTSGGALVTKSTSAASAPFGPDKIPAAKIATAMPLFHIAKFSLEKTKPRNCYRQRHSRACRQPRASVLTGERAF